MSEYSRRCCSQKRLQKGCCSQKVLLHPAVLLIWLSALTLQNLLPNASEAGMGVEAYVRHVMELNTQMGVMELASFVRTCSGSVCTSLNLQIWQPNSCNSFVLSGVEDLSEDVKPDTAAYHLMLVMLPKSCKLLWLPLLTHAHATPEFIFAKWGTRLCNLNTKMQLATGQNPPQAPAQQPPAKPVRVSAIAGRLQPNTRSAAQLHAKTDKKPACTDGKRKTKQDEQCLQRTDEQSSLNVWLAVHANIPCTACSLCCFTCMLHCDCSINKV